MFCLFSLIVFFPLCLSMHVDFACLINVSRFTIFQFLNDRNSCKYVTVCYLSSSFLYFENLRLCFFFALEIHRICHIFWVIIEHFISLIIPDQYFYFLITSKIVNWSRKSCPIHKPLNSSTGCGDQFLSPEILSFVICSMPVT